MLFWPIATLVEGNSPCIGMPPMSWRSSGSMGNREVEQQKQEPKTATLFQETLVQTKNQSPQESPEHLNLDLSSKALQSSETLALTKSTAPTAHNATYHEITRRIDQKELQALEIKMKTLSPCDHELFLNLVRDGNLSEIVEMPDYLLHALYAVQQGNLLQNDFATIVLPWASNDDEKICVSLFTGDEYEDQKTREMIESTLQIKGKPILSEDELNDFFKEMKNRPKLQQHFWLEKTREDPISLLSVRDGILKQYKGLNVFSKTGNHFMIPSAEMMQTFLKIKFKENAVRMNFVLGLSSTDDIEMNGSEDSRDAALRFPGTTLVKTADGHAALETDFTYHDFFHAIIASLNSPETRKSVIEIAKFVKSIKKDDPMLDRLYNSLIDMEISENYNQITKREIHPYTLETFIVFTFSQLIEHTPCINDTCSILHAMARHIWEHPDLCLKEPLQIANFFGLSMIVLCKALYPYNRLLSTDTIQNLRQGLDQRIQNLHERKEELKKVGARKENEINQIKKELKLLTEERDSLIQKTHPLQVQ